VAAESEASTAMAASLANHVLWDIEYLSGWTE
jgi:hypothetical protein